MRIASSAFTPLQLDFLRKMGCELPVFGFFCADREFRDQVRQAKTQHPEEDHETHEARAVARILHIQTKQEKRAEEKAFHLKPYLITIIILLILLLISSLRAHAQIDGIKVQKDGSVVGGPCAGGFCSLNFVGSGCSVTKSGQIWSVTCTSGSVTNNPGGTSNQLQTNNGAGAFGAIASAGLGKILIDQGPGNAPAFADPLVQGLYAAGTTTIPNPVIFGGSDYSGTPTLRTVKTDSSGNLYAVVTFAAPQHVIIDSSASIGVTGAFWQATQPISAAALPLPTGASTETTLAAMSAKLPAALDGSGFLKTHEQGTAAISAASLPLPSGASTAAKQPALGVAGTASADVITVQGIAGMTAVKVDGSAVTQPISGTVTTTPPSNASTNVAQVGGTAIDTNSGNKSAGTVRVVLATDQPNLTTAFNVNCTAGCTAGGSFADSSAFTFGTTAVGNMSAVVDDVSTNTVAENSAGAVRMNTNRILYVDLSKTAANATAIKVDNSAVTQPVSGTVAESNFPATVDTNSGAKSASTLRIVLATDQPALTNALKVDGSAVTQPVSGTVTANQGGTWTVQPGNTANTTAWKVDGSAVTQPVSGPVTDTQLRASAVPVSLASAPTTAVTNQGLTDIDAAIAAVGAAVPANASQVGGTDGTNLVRYYVDPCQRGIKTYSPVNISTATTVRFAAPASAKKTYICSILLFAAAADNVNIIEGTGGTCGTGTAGVTGGTTAATGPNVAANGGYTLGGGGFAVMATAGTNVDMCLITSAAVQLSGHISWVQF